MGEWFKYSHKIINIIQIEKWIFIWEQELGFYNGCNVCF